MGLPDSGRPLKKGDLADLEVTSTNDKKYKSTKACELSCCKAFWEVEAWAWTSKMAQWVKAFAA